MQGALRMKSSLTILAFILLPSLSFASAKEHKRILDAAMANQHAYEQLAYLTDHFAPRFSGSENLERAIEWGAAQMKEAGLKNIIKQPVRVPNWQRGEESAMMLAPSQRKIAMLGLGSSIATPPGGIKAPVEVLTSFDHLSDKVKGKIVLFNAPFTTYYEAVLYRVRGALEAAKFGAIATLVRSVTPTSLRSPHTGNMSATPSIPAAAISLEDADLIARLRANGEEVVVQLNMSAKALPDALSANLVGEIPGQTDEVVVLAAHIDSWDVGQGAQDDGAGCLAVLEAARIIQSLGLKPKRTLRIVWFTNEENGLKGAGAYANYFGSSLSKHVAAIENDSGMDKPVGLDVELPATKLGKSVLASLKKLSKDLLPLGKMAFIPGHGGADLIPLAQAGITTMSVRTDLKQYWNIHHTEADTFDKIDLGNLRRHIALMAVTGYALANAAYPPSL